MNDRTELASLGVAGLGVMGGNLALNVADHGFRVALWNRKPEVARALAAENGGLPLVATAELGELAGALERPRRVLMMVPAGAPVDEMIAKLAPLLEPGDILIDGGNTWFEDTRRREAELRERGIAFFGVGVSGGGEGARHGPSLMPGGDAEAYASIRPILEAIAARTDSGACVTHVGPDGAGHFVKMVHNGIEYADMQLIAEAYDVLGRGLGLSAERLAEVFERWNRGALESFLIEVTAKILRVREEATGKPLVELVLDRAEQKGTGRWTVRVAVEMGVPVPTIAAAVDARVLSSRKDERVRAAELLGAPLEEAPEATAGAIGEVRDALLAAKVVAYAQGFELIRAASAEHGWGIESAELARIWKAGCIIRARLLDGIVRAFRVEPDLSSLLLDRAFGALVRGHRRALQRTIELAVARGIPVPALGASLAHFDAFRTADLPQSLVQAQRDAFGSHGYVRRDDPEMRPRHTDWLAR